MTSKIKVKGKTNYFQLTFLKLYLYLSMQVIKYYWINNSNFGYNSIFI